MLEHSFIIALIVLSVWYTMQEGEIFGRLGLWFEKHLPLVMIAPAFQCNVCMCPWYGSVLYIMLYGVNLQWPVVVICAMGINIVINKLSPDK
jgi:hypothetical protein